MMKGKKLSMREIRKILQYRLDLQVSASKTAAILQKSKGVVIETMKRFKASGLSWPLPDTLTDNDLEEKLYPKSEKRKNDIPLPDLSYIQKEMIRPHVTLQRLFEEYKGAHPEGISRSSFFRYVRKGQPVEVTMRQFHKGGQTLYSDYSGDSLSYTDKTTGEVIKTQLFVCSWGASSYSYIEARQTQNASDFASVHVNSLTYFKATPHTIVPDNLKSAVTKADRYDPVINTHFGLMCDHYGITVLPARVRKPKDKAVVESNVLHVQEFVLARLRNRQFFSLSELNTALWEELENYNNRPMKDYGGLSRRQRFETEDLPFAKPLPKQPFTITRVKDNVKVARDYHVQFDKHFYSVPYTLSGKRIQIRQNGNLVEIYHSIERVSCHQLSLKKFSFTTKMEHMPPAHRYVKGWSSGYFLEEAAKIGPSTVRAIEILLKRTEHVEHGYRTARGILSLAKTYSGERLEKSCERALQFKNVSSTAIKSILQQGIDKQPLVIKGQATETAIILHENIRGDKNFSESL
jgi:transposase